MEIGVITELIGTVGFPIAVAIALGIFIWNIYKQSVVREEKLMEELTENRMVNTRFAEIIAGYDITLGEIKSDVKEIKDTLHIGNEQ